MSSLKKISSFLEGLTNENIFFKQHFFDKAKERPISESLVRTHLNPLKLLEVEQQVSSREDEEKYKLWLKLSNKYSLVVIAAISGKNLYIITAWNTDRKWQRSIRK